LSDVLQRASAPAVTEALVIGLPSGIVGIAEDFPAWSFDPKLVWIVPDTDSVKLMIRADVLGRQTRQTVRATALSSGCAAAIAARQVDAHLTRHVDFHAPLTCPWFGGSSTRYREVRDGLICPRCARSFVRDA
jgi:hypothetical protein